MLFVCAASWKAAAQTFDLRPQQQQKKSKKKDTERLEQLLDANDVEGMATLLQEEPELVNANSLQFKKASGAKRSVPLFFETVMRTLDGETPVEMCKVVINAGCELDVVFEGITPIYLVMDYIATHPKSQCEKAVQVLRAFAKRKDFDANKRYRSELPPLSYLIRRNNEFLGGKFSKDYIADEVLVILIEHGASVTTYTEKGASLMTFAIDTDNKYLQTYFIENGVNLRHNDAAGNDAVHHAIEQGDLALLKKMVSSGGVDIDINSFHNDTKQVAAYPDMYNYLADVCSQKAKSYEDLVLFRKRFNDKRDMVKQKYETMAQGELGKCQKFVDVMVVEGRYPDLPSLVNPRKQAFYRQDCQKLEGIHQRALNVAKQTNYTRQDINAFPGDFVRLYSQQYQYDPDHKIEQAKELQAFYQVCTALNFTPHRYSYRIDAWGSWANAVGSALFFLGLPKVREVYYPNLEDDRKILKNGLEACHSTSRFGYQDFLNRSESTIKEKYSQFSRYEERVYAEYHAYKEEEERKARARAEAKEARERQIRKAVDDELESIGITFTTSDWEQDWLDSFFGKAKHESVLTMEVEYSDGTEGKIIKYPNTNNYLPSRGSHFLFSDTYETLYDAIAAEFFFSHGATRYKGKD